MATAPEFTIDAYVDALTRLPDYGGYEALASGLREDFPKATFTPADSGYDKGFFYRDLPMSETMRQSGPFDVGQNYDLLKFLYSTNPAISPAPVMWPTLSRITQPRSVGKMGPISPTGGDLYEGKPSDDDWGKEHKGAVGEHLAWQQAGLGQDGSGQLPSAVPITQDKQRELANELEEQQKALSAPALAVSNPSFDLGAERYDIPQQIKTIRSAPVATDAGMMATQRVRPQVDPAGNIDLTDPYQPITGQQVTAQTTQNFQPDPVVGKVTDPIVASLPATSSVAPAFDQARTQPVNTLPSVYDTGAISVDIPAASGQAWVDDPLSLFEPYTIDESPTGSAGLFTPQNVIDEAPLLNYVGDPVEEVPFVIEGDYTPAPPSMADPELPAPIPVEEPMVQAPPVLADPEVAKVLNTVNQAPDWVLDLSAQRDYDQQLDTTQNTAPNTRYIADQQALAKEELPDPQPGWEEAKKAEMDALDEELQAGLEEFLEEQAIVDPGLTQVNLPDDSSITDTAIPVDDTVVTDDLVLDKPAAEELPLPTTAGVGIEGGTGLPKEPETNLKATVTNTPLTEVVPEGTSATAEPIDLTAAKRTLDDGLDLRERLAGRGKGWADSGEWGYARTRNLLTGGGQDPVVTQGPLVPWQSMGEDASSTRYLSNVGDRDYFPSRLAPGERLGETTAASEIDYVPEGEKVDYLRQNYGTSGTGGEGTAPFNKFLQDSDKVDQASLNRAVADFNRLKTHEYTRNTFTGVDTVNGFAETLAAPIKAGANAIESIVNFLTDSVGLTNSDVKDPKFFTWLNTPIDAISTNEIGIKPLDIMLVAAGGIPALGGVVMGKIMGGIFKPVTEGIKSLFGGNAEELSACDKADVMGEWERIMGIKGSDTEETDTNTYDPNNKLDVLMNGDYFISDPHRDAAERARNLSIDAFNSGDMMNLSGKRVAIFTNAQGNVINTANLNVKEGTTDIVPGPNNTAWGVYQAEGGEAAYEIKTLNGCNVTMNEWNNGKTNAPSGGGKQNVKTLWDWFTGLLPGGSEAE